jgi:hypothetical protein
MRRAIGSAVVAVLGATALSGVSFGQTMSSAPPTSSPPPRNWARLQGPAYSPPTRIWVHLHGPADLERLRATNFNHYLRARQILAAANEICRPGLERTYPTRFKDEYLSCESMLWLTSNPPKKVLEFHLDDVGYIALVSVTVGGTKAQLLGAEAITAK